MKTDVVIVGAGPGGCFLSYLLARSGVKTVLLERHERLDREFRGYFFQPLVLKFFEQTGLLNDVLQIKHEKVDAFHFIDHGKTLFSVRFDELPKPYDYGLIMSQPLLLQFLIDQALQYDNFSYFSGTIAKEFIKEENKIAGIKAKQKKQEIIIESRLVVGADGRYSTIRKLAGIPLDKESHQFDFVWFDMPALEGKRYLPHIQIEDEGMLIYIPKGSGVVQVGWVIRKGTYPDLRKKGIEYFQKQLIAVDPELEQQLSVYLHDFKQCSVLDIQVATSNQWVQDGLMLIGDAAHIASPFSGQGNSLAIQDAVVAHDVIMKALPQVQSSLAMHLLKQYEDIRRPAVSQIQKIQRIQAELIGVKNPLLLHLRRAVIPMISKTFLLKKMRNKIAIGIQPLDIATFHFKN
ncbi:FAD-dependent oxidoreductase (plasmid) [Bacillus cereus]|uniref:Possible monooxygenase n=1 Tax=Bacillus cereus (strain ZK / E33L) TaxID=288681 RepID=Q4V217_BACCZ|nr:FAD-dependent oxidoreductase [Bacillus cereus]AAY60240.1 possible monooxygenase [Bacillus cereus E33L]AJI26314.1 squalene epoxidase family protein [Bacillus cereus E33L]QQA19066.1 FAD-dependent oxidoreductase [Bacillus cereus]